MRQYWQQAKLFLANEITQITLEVPSITSREVPVIGLDLDYWNRIAEFRDLLKDPPIRSKVHKTLLQ